MTGRYKKIVDWSKYGRGTLDLQVPSNTFKEKKQSTEVIELWNFIPYSEKSFCSLTPGFYKYQLRTTTNATLFFPFIELLSFIYSRSNSFQIQLIHI